MIRHQAVCVNDCIKTLTGFLLRFKKGIEVRLIMKDGSATSTTVHYMMKRSFIFNSGRYGDD
ncbi:MAG: hypothetical protein IEMM0001_1308 [bacterium]|nr:MAG: hypothetical protein IEMM0001_1308 [bacterium]